MESAAPLNGETLNLESRSERLDVEPRKPRPRPAGFDQCENVLGSTVVGSGSWIPSFRVTGKIEVTPRRLREPGGAR
jgi:hypothetical protein